MLMLLFSRKWTIPTIVVITAMAVMIRLGIWQLDRLEQRRAFNSHYLEQVDAEPFNLNLNPTDPNLIEFEYRQVIVTGQYDHNHEVAIRNQSWGNQIGVHLLTPLKIEGGDEFAVLVDRGWIPLETYQTGNWEEFSEPGIVSVSGIIRLSQKPSFGGRPDPTPLPGESLKAWNFINIPEISKQMPYLLLPIYIQQSPGSSWTVLPYRTQPEIEITEGPHLSYAIQWFIFASILGIGYPFFVRKESTKKKNT